jgi:SAM-dependent methyltransferase
VPQSDWSAVDTATEPRRLLSGLDSLRTEPFFRESKALIATLLADAVATRVLDVGCGTGEDAYALGGNAIGIENSRVMCEEARARHRDLALVIADARALPIRDAAVDALRADRVVQHLRDAPVALREWRRVLRRGGRVVTFDPDLTTASVDGVDERAASTVLEWRLSTRGGATVVHTLRPALEAAGFTDVRIETRTLELSDLDRADGIMGLATWAHAAAQAGACSTTAAQLWNDDVRAAGRNGTLRYRCTYLLASATAG